jgi:glycosyltransferase involved in cell wall biosynthesis
MSMTSPSQHRLSDTQTRRDSPSEANGGPPASETTARAEQASQAAVPPISVVIPTARRPAVLPLVIPPLLSDPATREVIVVIDGSDEASEQVLERLAKEDERVRPLVLHDNVGVFAARRAGAAASRSDVVLLLDDDVLARPGLVSGHARRHADGKPRLVIGYAPVVLDHDRRPGRFASYLYAHEYESVIDRYSDATYILSELWGGNFSLPARDFIGLVRAEEWDPRLYSEDRYVGLELRRQGYEAVFDRSLLADHLHERDYDAFIRGATAYGRAVVTLPGLVDGQLPNFELDLLDANLGPVSRLVVHVLARPELYELSIKAIGILCKVAGLLRLYRLENVAARLARRVTIRWAALDELGGG